MNSREKVMEMVRDGTLSVEEGLRLLEAIEESEKKKKRPEPAPEPLIRSSSLSRPRMLKVFVEAANGDKVRVNVPTALVRAGLDFSRQMELSGIHSKLEGVDLELILKMVEEGQIGELVDVVSAQGDKVRIVVE